MVIVGLLLLAVAVAAAVIFIADNRSATMNVHALGNTWNVHAYWILVAGLVIMAVALIGLRAMSRGAARGRRLRRERRSLARENERLSGIVERHDNEETPVADESTVPVMPAAPIAPMATDTMSGGPRPTVVQRT